MIEKLLDSSKNKGTTEVEIRSQIQALAEVLKSSDAQPEIVVNPDDKTDPTIGVLHLKLVPPPNFLTPKSSWILSGNTCMQWGKFNPLRTR